MDCALTAAKKLLEGYHLAYALVRPPGHLAEPATFHGFCYFNSPAVAAQLLSTYRKTAILNVDYHHGNGQQEIFYDRPDILTISIHGHPSFAYSYFSGFVSEKGRGAGKDFNINMPLLENIDGELYHRTLKDALKRITSFRTNFLVIALGLDTAKEDPTGSWSLVAEDFESIGKMIG